ncbi:MAG: DUF1415 domain-containing protein [Bacteroidota bacterium]
MDPIEATRNWVESFVVKLGLCPFAAQPMLENTVRFCACTSDVLAEQLTFVRQEISLLQRKSSQEIMTTMIVFPQGLTNFYDFLDFIEANEVQLSQLQLGDFVQLAHFHPHYMFAGVPPEDPANATNRSPFPVIHLLRVKEMSDAIKSYPEVDKIPERNIALLRNLFS